MRSSKRARTDTSTAVIVNANSIGNGTMQMVNTNPAIVNAFSHGNLPVPQNLYRNVQNQNVLTSNGQSIVYNLNTHAAQNNPVRMQQTIQRPLQVATQTVFSKALDCKYNIDASQIRIGTFKFYPDTSVTFKNEGVLFSLKGKLA